MEMPAICARPEPHKMRSTAAQEAMSAGNLYGEALRFARSRFIFRLRSVFLDATRSQ